MLRVERPQAFGQQETHFVSAGDAVPGDVDPVEKIVLRRLPGQKLERLILGSAPRGRAESLALVLGAALRSHLVIGFPQQRIIFARIDPKPARVFGLGLGKAIPEQPPGLPRRDIFQLFGEAGLVGGGREGFLGQYRGGPVVAVPAGVIRGEPGDDHVGPEFSDHPDDVRQDFFLPPELECFLGGLGIAEIDGPREILFGPVDPAGRQELLGPDDPDLGALFRADQVLAALAAGEGQVGRPELSALREIGQDGRVLIVRMGGHVEDAAKDVELVKGDVQVRGTDDPGRLGLDMNAREQGHSHGHRHELF